MKIGILGFGYVGSAIAWAYRHEDLIIVDPKLQSSAKIQELSSCDAIFVCVPSPAGADGKCDSTILENVLKELASIRIEDIIPIISKTTAPPSVYKKLLKEYRNLVYSPEFLRAKHNVIDFANSDYVVLGGNKEWCRAAIPILQKGLHLTDDRFIIKDIATAALYKYMMNCYLATKVTFMNEFKELADAEGVLWDDLKSLAREDSRIGKTHMNVPGDDGEYGWNGVCFPKDIAAITEEAIDLGLEFELLQRVESINTKHRRK